MRKGDKVFYLIKNSYTQIHEFGVGILENTPKKGGFARIADKPIPPIGYCNPIYKHDAVILASPLILALFGME